MKLTVLLCVALIATLGAVSAKSTSTSVGRCSKQDEGVTYGVPSDCHQYIVCKKETLQLKACESKYNYDTVTSQCVKAKTATCAVDAVPEEPQPAEPVPEEPEETDDQYDYLCVKVLYGVRIHPNTCDKYLVCSEEKAKIEYCDDGFIFLADAIQCVKGNKVSCSIEQDEPSTTQEPPATATTETTEKESEESGEGSEESVESSKETEGQYDYLCEKKFLGWVAHPESCTKYITCRKYKAKEESCKEGYSYSSKLGLCVKQNNGSCADAPQDPPTTTEEPATVTTPSKPDSGESDSGENSGSSSGKYDYVCENVADGKYAHPDSCTKYITCKKQKAKEESCKKGRYYSTYLQTCIKGNLETCADNNGNHGTATAPPSVTETTTTPPVSVTLGPSYPTDSGTYPTETTTVDAITELTPPGSGGDPMEPTVDCVEGFTGYLPVANDCTKYVYCFQGEPGQRSCLEEYIYYAPFNACLPGDPVLCQLYRI